MGITRLSHQWHARPPLRFSNGEIFLIVASMADGVMGWGVPDFLLQPFREQVGRMSGEELFDPNIQRRLSAWLDTAVGFSLPVIRWRTAAEYYYRGEPPIIPAEDPAIWNQDYTPPVGINLSNNPARALELLKNQPYCAAVIEGDTIASLCYCSHNGPISGYTRPASRRRGYALSCLRLLTKKCLEAGFDPCFPGDVSNVASVHLAEKAGYKLEQYMFWISIPPIADDKLPPRLQEQIKSGKNETNSPEKEEESGN